MLPSLLREATSASAVWQAKLAKFSDKVPAAVVEQERQRLADWSAQLDALSSQRARL